MSKDHIKVPKFAKSVKFITSLIKGSYGLFQKVTKIHDQGME